MTGPRGWGEAWSGEHAADPVPGVGSTPPDSDSEPDGAASPGGSARLSLTDLMDRVIGAIRAAPRVTWTFGAVIVAVLGVVQGLVGMAIGLPARLDALADGPWGELDTAAELAALIGQAVVSTLGWIVSVVATAFTAAFAAVALGVLDGAGAPTVRGVWRAVRPRLGGVVALALLLVGAVALGAALPVLAGVGVAAAGAGPGGVAGVVAVAGIAVVIAQVRVLPALALAVPWLVTGEGGGGGDGGPGAALRASWRGVRGARWALVGIWLLTTIVLSIASGVVAAPFGWLATVLASTGAGATHPGALTGAVALLGGVVSAAVTAPIGALVLAAVQADLAAPAPRPR